MALNCDFDRLHELVNNHLTLRQMLGHADFGIRRSNRFRRSLTMLAC